MKHTTYGALDERLFKAEFPRSSQYDSHWLMANAMGPHVLWLAEWLSERLELTSGMRVLDPERVNEIGTTAFTSLESKRWC